MNEFWRCQTALGKLAARKDCPMASGAATGMHLSAFSPRMAFATVRCNADAELDWKRRGGESSPPSPVSPA